jgi:hypothetical protein
MNKRQRNMARKAHPTMRLSMITPLCSIPLSALLVLLVVTGCAKISKQSGVENRWRDQNVAFQAGVTTQQEVLAQLGPPSQIIALPHQTVFYYLFEEVAGRLMFLILYNQANTTIKYDRAIFFFKNNGILEEYAFSKKDND